MEKSNQPPDPEYLFNETTLRLIRLVESLNEIFYRFRRTPGPVFDYISPTVESITGYSPEEHYRDPSLSMQVVHPEDREKLAPVLEGLVVGDPPLTVRVTHKSGHVVWLEYDYTPVHNAAGEVEAVEGFARDVTPLHKYEDELGHSRALLASIIDTAVDAVIVLDPEQRVTLFNQAAEIMFGHPARDVLGKPLDRFLPDSIGEWHSRQILSFGRRGEIRHHMGEMRETTGIRSNGEEFPIEASLSSFDVGPRRFYTAFIRDTTERKKVEEELRHISTHDPLTGLYNRFFFEEELARLEGGRSPDPVTIMIADVDGLKNVNDRYGHLSGDDLIRTVAQALRSAFRTEDVVARLGGDEFGVILINSDRRFTERAVQRIYERLGAYNRENGGVSADLSIGIATARVDESLNETIKRADRNMYQHKNVKSDSRRSDFL
jgi:diguanylate cyclase (GGDEF)-like protein/PAS domain S-box-containing protein